MRFFILLLISTQAFSLSGKKLKEAERILRKAEEIRAPEQGVSQVDLISKSKKKEITYELEVLMGTGKRAFLDFKSPAIEKGRRMLVVGQKYFAKFRHSRSAIPISRREAVGNSTFALADIFQIDLDDYKILKMEKSKGGELMIEMKAKRPDVPYDKINYFVDDTKHFPKKAHFFGTSGRHLKSLFVEEKKKFNGVLRASKVRMDDVVQTDKKSWWNTKEIKEKTIPSKVFTKDYLVRD